MRSRIQTCHCHETVFVPSPARALRSPRTNPLRSQGAGRCRRISLHCGRMRGVLFVNVLSPIAVSLLLLLPLLCAPQKHPRCGACPRPTRAAFDPERAPGGMISRSGRSARPPRSVTVLSSACPRGLSSLTVWSCSWLAGGRWAPEHASAMARRACAIDADALSLHQVPDGLEDFPISLQNLIGWFYFVRSSRYGIAAPSNCRPALASNPVSV